METKLSLATGAILVDGRGKLYRLIIIILKTAPLENPLNNLEL